MMKYNPIRRKGKFRVFSKTQVPFTVRAVDSAEAKYKVGKLLGEKEYWTLYCICLEQPVYTY